jgi:hypothetical protein
MKISTEQRQYYKSLIRSVIAQHPQISQMALATQLESEGLKLDRKYLGSLLNDIYVERSKRANTWMLNQALSAFQDVMMEISARRVVYCLAAPRPRSVFKTTLPGPTAEEVDGRLRRESGLCISNFDSDRSFRKGECFLARKFVGNVADVLVHCLNEPT